jgi:OmpA-OmpF porin, OOP family
MRQSLTLLILLLCSINLIAQQEKVKTYFDNGQIESAGTFHLYFTTHEKIPKKFRYLYEIRIKDKKWKYWYPNGHLKRIENYKVDANIYTSRNKKWIYFNEDGIKYREDFYKNRSIYNTIKDIYQDSILIGKISIKKGISDTIIMNPVSDGQNLIANPDFEMYFYKPVPIVYHGQTKLEDWLPFWNTPGAFSPDYLSDLRRIDVLDYKSILDSPLPDKFNYLAFALYKDSDSYSEYIQGKLIKPLSTGQKYCLKVSIALSSYSGFSINQIAGLFSQKPITIRKNESTFSPQVKLSLSEIDNKRFKTLCSCFTAEGGEQFVTLGRFTSDANLEILPRTNIPQSQFGIDKSAYYLIDNIELVEISDPNDCPCEINIIQTDTLKTIPKPDLNVPENEITKLKQGNSVILKNVNFEFDKYELLPSSDTILMTLKKFLIDNPDIRLMISGHTDDVGSDDYNLKLSINRAKSVYYWLIDKGIDTARLEFTGYGKSHPLHRDSDEKFRALNRRVEVKVINP